MQTVSTPSAARAIHRLMFEALKREDTRLNELASEALAGMGQVAVHTIVLEAATTVETQYRLRLLRIVEQIGEVPDPDDHLLLFEMTRDQDFRVQHAAARTIMVLRRHRKVIPVVAMPTAVERPAASSPGEDGVPLLVDTASSGGVIPAQPLAHMGVSHA